MQENVTHSISEKDVIQRLSQLLDSKNGSVLNQSKAPEESFKPERFSRWVSRVANIPLEAKFSITDKGSIKLLQRRLLNLYEEQRVAAKKAFADEVKKKKSSRKRRRTRGDQAKGFLRAVNEAIVNSTKNSGETPPTKPPPQGYSKTVLKSRKRSTKKQSRKAKGASKEKEVSMFASKGSGPIIYSGAFEMNRRKH